MTLTSRIVTPLVCLMLWTAPLAADAVSPSQHSALNVAVNQFETDFFGGNYDAVANGIPPKIISLIADRAGMDPSVLKGMVADQMESAMKQVMLTDYSMNQEEAQWSNTETGRAYALVPTQLKLLMADGKTAQSNTFTLAFEDDNAWYLVRIDDLQQVSMLSEAYPDFKGITFPQASFKILD